MTEREMSPAQKQAVEHKDGPMMVLAGPGSGKTFVITKRTEYLTEQCGINPARILVITFTRAAAEEMKERFLASIHETHTTVSFGTFHAVFFKILKYAYNFTSANIISEEDRQTFLKEIIAAQHLELEDEKDFLEGIAAEISLVKGEGIDLAHYYSMNCADSTFQTIYNAYHERLGRAGKIDFDDMLLLCLELFKARPDILKQWQQKFTYILIDEFQDINRVQYDIIRMLALPENNLFIVGDDDQSIYRFRGAKPEIMLNFEKDYPQAKRVLLERNYRSSAQIVEMAGRVIANNKNRFAKEIVAARGEGEPVVIKEFQGLTEQNTSVVKELRAYHEKGIPYREMAVLFRTNLQPRALLEKLMEYNIPFRMKDAVPNLYDHWIANNLKAYMKLAMGERDRGLFLQIANRPKRYLARESFPDPVVDFEALRAWYADKDWMLERIDKLQYDLSLLRTTNPFAAVNYIRRGIGYDEYLQEYAQYRRMKPEELSETIDELAESTRECRTYEEWFRQMEDYKKELAEQAKNRNNKEYDGVSLATMHSAKGLEFRVVFLVDVNEGITPHHKASMEEEMEEERRMFYVGMTRAKDKLHVYYAKERYNKAVPPSRFIGEMKIDTALLRAGERISHAKYGAGTIIQIRDGRISIQFDGQALPRTLDLEFCVSAGLLVSVEKAEPETDKK